MGPSSQAELTDCHVRGCGQRGLVAGAGASVVVQRCCLSSSRASGVLLADAGTRATLRDCNITNNGLHGCSVQGQASLCAENNQVRENGRSGFAVTMQAHARLEDNGVELNGRSGLVVTGGSRATLRANRFASNAKCGVLCHGAHVRVRLVGDTLADNVGSGLVVQEKAQASAAGLLVRANTRFGVLVHGAGSALWTPPHAPDLADATCLEGGFARPGAAESEEEWSDAYEHGTGTRRAIARFAKMVWHGALVPCMPSTSAAIAVDEPPYSPASLPVTSLPEPSPPPLLAA